MVIQPYCASGFWSSRQDPEKPVRLWFQFNEPKRVTKIKFKEIFALASGYGYEVNETSLTRQQRQRQQQQQHQQRQQREEHYEN